VGSVVKEEWEEEELVVVVEAAVDSLRCLP
jgi:hypothetical protein